MAKVHLPSLPKVEPRDSIFSLDEIIDLSSRKDKNNNTDSGSDLTEIALCLANEIKKLQKSCRCKTYEKEQEETNKECEKCGRILAEGITFTTCDGTCFWDRLGYLRYKK